MGTSGEGGIPDDYDELRREVEALRVRVADLQRAAARHQDAPEKTVLAAQEELLREAEQEAAHAASEAEGEENASY